VLAAYLGLSLWFLLVDLAASRIIAGRVPPPRWTAVFLALAWPIAMACALTGQALIIRRLMGDLQALRGSSRR